MLRMLGDEELQSILAEQGQIEVNCDFCNTHYAFDKVDATQLLMTPVAAPSQPNVH
jgi:molecular chaperone Hsp33